MHPEVTQASPGECTICRMALEPAVRAAAPAPDPSATQRSRVFDVVRQRFFSEPVYAPAWLDAEGWLSAIVYKDDVAALGPGDPIAFFPADSIGSSVPARRTQDPPVDWDTSTSLVRLTISTSDASGRPTRGWITVPPRPRPAVVVPADAVRVSREGHYVLVAPSRDVGRLEARRIEIGRVFNGYASVVSGLAVDEIFVAENAFFLDAERLLHGTDHPSSETEP